MKSTDAPLLIGIDVGTTSIKAAAHDVQGRMVSSSSTPTMTHYPRPHWAYYRADEIWALTVSVLHEVLAGIEHPERIVSVAVTSMGEAGVPVDASGEALYDIIAWFDTRTHSQVAWLDHTIGKDALFATSGLSLQPIFGLCKLLWLKDNEPDLFDRTATWLNMADYIAYRLSGVAATDYSLASRTLALNLAELQWDENVLHTVGVDSGILAPLVESGTALGTVTPAAAEASGLPATAVVAAGGHDHVCGALATGVHQPGSMLNSLGTAEAIFLPLEQPVTDPAMGRQGYTQGAHVIPGKYYAFGGQYTSGASIAWMRDIAGASGSLNDLLGKARDVPPGSLGVCFLPHLRLANPPHDDPIARGAFVGLTMDVDAATLMRSVLEGLAFETRTSLEGLLQYAGVKPPQSIIVTGGGTRSSLLLDIKASALNRELQIAHTEEATTHGAAILGGIAAGVYQDAEAAMDMLQGDERIVKPVIDWQELYDDIFTSVYRQLYASLQPLNHDIHRIQTAVGDPEPAIRT